MVVVARPVDLLAAGVGRDDERFVETGGVREAVQRADAVHRDAEHVAEGGGGHQSDPQPRVGAGADADHNAGDGVELGTGFAQHPVDGGHQQFSVTPGVDLGGLGEHVPPVVERGGDGGRGGVEGEEQHGAKPTARTGC